MARLASAIIGLGLVLSLLAGMASAMELQPAPAPPSAGQVTRSEIQDFVDQLYANKLTVDDVKAFHARLTDSDRDTLGELTAAKVGMSKERWQAIRDESQAAAAKPSVVKPLEDGQKLWQQMIPVGTGGEGTYAATYWQDALCDGDASDNETVFYYNMSYGQDQSRLRWNSYSPIVWNTLATFYPGGLLGFSYSWATVQLCLGDAINLCGGAEGIKNNLFLYAQ